VCIEKATRLAKSQQNAGKEYVCVFKLHSAVDSEKKVSASSCLYVSPFKTCGLLISLRLGHCHVLSESNDCMK
jgi:hypothetical protein